MTNSCDPYIIDTETNGVTMTRIAAKWILYDRGVSLAKAARAYKVSHPYLSNVLNGHKEPSQKLRINLSRFLNLPESVLFVPVPSISHVIIRESGFNFKQKKLHVVEKPAKGDE